MKENREKASVEITTFFNNKLQEIKDPVVRDFAFSGLENLRKELSENGSMPSDITAVKDDIQKRFSIIHKRAEKEAEAWKQNNLKLIRDIVKDYRDMFGTDAPKKVSLATDTDALNAILAALPDGFREEVRGHLEKELYKEDD